VEDGNQKSSERKIEACAEGVEEGMKERERRFTLIMAKFLL